MSGVGPALTLRHWPLAGARVIARSSAAADGNFAVDGDPRSLAARRSRLYDGPWTWLRQVHGAEVVTVTRPGEHASAEADAAVTAVPGAVLAVQAADCAPVVLLADGVVGVAHAGWRGLVAGVLPTAVGAMRAIGAREVRALLGPCVHPGCYELGEPALGQLATLLGRSVVSRTAGGAPALDLPAAVTASLGGVGVALDAGGSTCTACTPDTAWSHRARGEAGRQAALAWLA